MNYGLLGERIKKERLNRGLTQEVLAEKANISVSFLGQIERGERKLSLETLIKIGEVSKRLSSCSVNLRRKQD